MKFVLGFFALALVISSANCSLKNLVKTAVEHGYQRTAEEDYVDKGLIDFAIQLVLSYGCGLKPPQEINSFLIDFGTYFLNFSTSLVLEHSTTVPRTILVTGDPEVGKPDTVNFRQDLIDSFFFGSPDNTDILEFDQEVWLPELFGLLNIKPDWPFSCGSINPSDYRLIKMSFFEPDYPDLMAVKLRKVFGAGGCHNFLLHVNRDERSVSLAALRSGVSCDSTDAPYI